MGNIFAEALKKVGFEVNNEYIPWEKFSEVKLPFGSVVGITDSDIGGIVYRASLKSFNFLRKNATSFDISKFDIRTNDYVTDFLRKNQDKCRVLPKSSCKETYPGYLGTHSSYTEREFECDAGYGLSDIVCYFEYSTQYEKFIFHISTASLNYNNIEQNQLRDELRKTFDFGCLYGTCKDKEENKALFEYCVKNIFPKCEFIPISISENDGCVLSHKGYMDRIFGYQQEITSPCLGKNIKKHEEYMKGLSSWIEKGGYIKDNMFYLIIEDRKSIEPHTYYLRPWKVD